MDTQHLSAPTRPQSLNPRGVTHINTPHTSHYTVVGNHLAQHRELSLTAIGLGLHIQSLPSGARVDIKTLAARFPEGETSVAAALRELEAHGYLARIRERLPNGRIVTHTVSYNQPAHRRSGHTTPTETEPASDRSTPKTPASKTPPAPPPTTSPEPEPTPAPPPPPSSSSSPSSSPPAEPEPAATPEPPLPEPRTPDLDRHRAATALLTTLHHHDPRLLLPERAVRRLAPAVAAWLERGAHPDAVRHALTANLPRDPLRHPAALLAHRLTECLPPLPPGPALRPHPLQTCDGCDRAFRSPHPGRCRDCRTNLPEVA
ncbi:helix-turn-helix domain-containing protein [Streptomyces echinoruber]|uniref:DNA-binding protein n=1 Tax=Streptomyces echinoruber TaxID=68898 RepID=A0A918VED6_9ACTN|nr:helix-turn-helix domain-containing protein [Streptomyces echinoruber]GGZ91244.1 hypothetical protein GCM10010389_32210 [Streptomyces echinoruber]